jgi:hypothetical protein
LVQSGGLPIPRLQATISRLGTRIQAPMAVRCAALPTQKRSTLGEVPHALAPIAPADLTAEQKPLYDDMRRGISASFNAFIAERNDAR